MPAGNTLIGDVGTLYESDFERAQPFSQDGVPVATDANRVANYVAFLVLFALAVLILIRLAGLQGMIAVGRTS